MSDCSKQAWKVPSVREPGVLYMHGNPGTDYASVNAIEVDGNRFIRSTGIENDMFFILPKPKERVAYYGQIERVEDDGSLKMYQSVQLVDEALKRWKGQIEDDIQRRLFETFAKPQEDENGAYVMVDGQRFERADELVDLASHAWSIACCAMQGMGIPADWGNYVEQGLRAHGIDPEKLYQEVSADD